MVAAVPPVDWKDHLCPERTSQRITVLYLLIRNSYHRPCFTDVATILFVVISLVCLLESYVTIALGSSTPGEAEIVETFSSCGSKQRPR